MELILAILKLKKSAELLFNSLDILPKEQLIKFSINKKFNNKESFFYFLDYINEVKIITVNEKDDSKDEQIKKNKVTDKEPQLIIDFLGDKITVEINKKIKKENKNNIDLNLSDGNEIKELEEDYGKKISIKNINIENFFLWEKKLQ